MLFFISILFPTLLIAPVADTFNDSDFAAGGVEARGHKVKASYKISKNFSAAAAYLAAEGYQGKTTDTFQLDLKAKF